MRELLTTIVSCRVSQAHPTPGGRKGKKDTTSSASGTPTLEVILHDTIIFPEGGGQPSDTGLMQINDESVWRVLQAKRHGGHAVHYVQVEDAEVDIHRFTAGTRVLVKLGGADWDRRYDHVSVYSSLEFVFVTSFSYLDDYAYLSAPLIRCSRASPEYPDAFLVFGGRTCSMLC